MLTEYLIVKDTEYSEASILELNPFWKAVWEAIC